MKISVCGTQCSGKSTFIDDFIKNWTMYSKCKTPGYRELAKERKIKLNEEGNEDSQKSILDILADQVIYAPKKDNIIFDRSVLDNLAYTMWLNANGKVSDQFVRKTMKIARETLPFYDILFFLPITKQSPVDYTPSENRSTNPQYRSEIDNIFKALVHQYNIGNKVYFPFDHELGCPAIIEIFGNREERIQLTKMYIKPDGSAYTEESSLLSNIDPQEKPHILDFQ